MLLGVYSVCWVDDSKGDELDGVSGYYKACGCWMVVRGMMYVNPYVICD